MWTLRLVGLVPITSSDSGIVTISKCLKTLSRIPLVQYEYRGSHTAPETQPAGFAVLRSQRNVVLSPGITGAQHSANCMESSQWCANIFGKRCVIKVSALT